MSAAAREIIEGLRRTPLPVVIAGAGTVGQTLLHLLREAGVPVACFCDNSEKVARTRVRDLEVVHVPELRRRFPDAEFVVSVAAIKDAVDRLREQGYGRWHAGGVLLKDADLSRVPFDLPADKALYAAETCVLCHDAYLHPERLFLRSVDVIITERCSLRCKDCANLMQYYEQPRNCDTATVLRSIDALCAVVDEVIEFRILGGEAFVNADWPVVLRRLTDEPKGKRVVIYTNATFVPNEQQLAGLRGGKVLVSITNYGKLSTKFAPLRRALEENGVPFFVTESPEWLDCASIAPRGRTPAQLREVYNACCAKNILTLSDGKLFRCPYAANAHRLAAVPDRAGDYVDLFAEPLAGEGLAATRRKVREYLTAKEYLETCDFCSGRPLCGPEVPPAVQAGKPLAYRKYPVHGEGARNRHG